MLKDFLSDEKFCELTRGYVQGTIELLLEKNCEFGIVISSITLWKRPGTL